MASSTLATTWSYLTNANDRRLSGISNTGLIAGHFSNFTYTTTPENFISGISESSDATAVYPPAGTQTATYNNLNQLTNLSGQALTFDTVGNLTSDSARNYTWDAEYRLIGITYPGVSGKATAFTYDGLGRRVVISSTPPGGGSATVTNYVWCGKDICQARNAANTAIRSYFTEGELVPGTPNQPYYYGIDQLGTVRRAFMSTSSAPAFGYDPYGLALQVAAPVTDFAYAGLFYSGDSGLHLATYRAFDPVAGRWLSRDPIGEVSDVLANLYAYVGGNTQNYTDAEGLIELFREGGVTVHSYPGPQAGGREHARQGPGQAYHVHVTDRAGNNVRMSTETWKPLTPRDEQAYRNSKEIRSMCENLSEGQKKFMDRVNREVFHKGRPTIPQMEKLGWMSGGSRGRAFMNSRGDP